MIFLQASAGGFGSMLPFLAMIVVIYFFMIRPQMTKQKKEKKFQAEITKGTRVITSSGIHGKIVELHESDNTVTIETGAGKIKFERAAISLDLTNKLNAPAKNNCRLPNKKKRAISSLFFVEYIFYRCVFKLLYVACKYY